MTEQALIDRLLAASPPLPAPVQVGPGDDAAVLRLGGDAIVVTTDAQVEGVHFERPWLSPAELGARAILVAVSDLAAMGAAPVAAFVSLLGRPEDFPEAFARGLGEACAHAGVALAGGNVSAPGPAGGLVVDVTIVGRLDGPAAALLRSGGRPGDTLYVSGPLGLARAGCRLLSAGRPDDDPVAVAAWRRPPLRLDLGAALRRTGRVHACMDLSDGLAADLPRLCAASGVGAEVRAQAVPGPPDDRLVGGEDYELLVAAPPGAGVEAMGLVPIGRLAEGAGVRWVDAGGRDLGALRGFDHYDPAAGR